MYEQPQPAYPPQQPPYPGQPPVFQPPTPPKKKTGKILGIVAGVLLALLCCCGVGVAAAWNSEFGKGIREGFTEAVNSDPQNAKLGDCITETVKEDASDAKVVDCSKPEAKYKVAGIVTGVSESKFVADDDICADFPAAESAIWLGRTSGSGRVLCLAPKQ